MEGYFHDFLRGLTEADIKAECYLPKFVNSKMEQGCTVRSYPSTDKWFGMTYSEDRPDVMARLKSLVDDGVYPEKLF